jgi:hypothetical protein
MEPVSDFSVVSLCLLMSGVSSSSFLQDLRQTCLSDPGNKEFWSQVQKQGREMSLISKPEAAKNGGISTIPESDAEEVSSNFVKPSSLAFAKLPFSSCSSPFRFHLLAL